ncbi:MAG: hypothetical protein O7D86_11485 [Proteobacteria bacterium]|nr:hypothetical protein [Pseudomonadota bacterium]
MSPLNVYIQLENRNKCHLGQLAYKDSLAYLELNNDFIDLGINISPYQIKLEKGLQVAEREPFNLKFE